MTCPAWLDLIHDQPTTHDCTCPDGVRCKASRGPGDCPNRCGWTNIYRTCQDGSREAAEWEHLRGCGGAA